MLLVASSSTAQQRISEFQMYDDFDEFVSIIQDCNPQLLFRKAVTGFDQLQHIISQREQIDTITSQESFFDFLSICLSFLHDIHIRETTEFYNFDNLFGVDTLAIIARKKYLHDYSPRPKDFNNRSKRNSIFGAPIYYKGDYYALGRYLLITHNFIDTLILQNPKIIAYNYTPFFKYAVNQRKQNNFRWDYTRGHFFSLNAYTPAEGFFTVENEGDTIEFRYEEFYGFVKKQIDSSIADSLLIKYNPREKRKVHYFDDTYILYIYLDAMSQANLDFAEEIKKNGTGKKINKVIIDVRGNRGGNDLVWHNLLKAIIADSLYYNPQSALLNTERLKQYYRYPNSFADIDSLKIHNFSWLPEQEFLITNFSPTYIIPDTNSLNYSGKIYILNNQYSFSSALALSSFAKQSEQLVSVGESTGMLAGMGIAAALFQLKHSKFTFRLSTLIEITNAKTPIDVYQDFPEIMFEIPLDDFLRYHNYSDVYDIRSKEYLLKFDFLFKEVMNLK